MRKKLSPGCSCPPSFGHRRALGNRDSYDCPLITGALDLVFGCRRGSSGSPPHSPLSRIGERKVEVDDETEDVRRGLASV